MYLAEIHEANQNYLLDLLLRVEAIEALTVVARVVCSRPIPSLHYHHYASMIAIGMRSYPAVSCECTVPVALSWVCT